MLTPMPPILVDPPCVAGNCTGICWLYGDCPPLPPPPPIVSIPIAVHQKIKLLPIVLIATASVLALIFLLFLIFYSLIRRRNRRRLLFHQQQQQQVQAPHPHAGDLFLDVGDDHDGDGPHHVWLIRTVGLDESVIKSITAVVYESGDGLIDCEDCTVCLGEFTDGEVIKLLPKCGHAFHLSCIDTWLRSHVNCPICRAPVVAPVTVGPSMEADVSESAPTETQPSLNQEESVIAIDLTAGSSSGPLDEVQPIRRSVSMDSSSLGRLMLRADLESGEKLGEERKELEISKKGGKQQSVVEMKRSLSSRSDRFFFSRYGRGRTASVLPL